MILLCCLPPARDDQAWIVDTGASHHITGDHSVFSAYTPLTDNPKHPLYNTKMVNAAGTEFNVEGTGDVMINASVTLRDVIYAPGCAYNLLSGSCAVASGYAIELDKHGCDIRLSGGDIVAHAPRGKDGLFRLSPPTNYALSVCASAAPAQTVNEPADIDSPPPLIADDATDSPTEAPSRERQTRGVAAQTLDTTAN